jgi:hypothetical protein
MKIPIGKDVQMLESSKKKRALRDLIGEFRDTLIPPLKMVESRFEKSFPLDDIESKITNFDVDRHFDLVGRSWRAIREAEVLSGGRAEIPACSLERLDRVKINIDYETPKPAVALFNVGLMWSREDNEYSLFLDYVITHVREFATFEWLESQLPDAAYFDFYVPAILRDRELTTVLVDSWRDLSEASKRYQVHESVDPKDSRYSALLEIDDVHISLDLNTRTKELHIRKHMNQGKSMPPTKILERIERNDELVVLTARIPLWLKQRLEREAEQQEEQLGTHLRSILERKYE